MWKEARQTWFALSWYWRLGILALSAFILIKFFRILDILLMVLTLCTWFLIAAAAVITVIGVSAETKNAIFRSIAVISEGVSVKLKQAKEAAMNPGEDPEWLRSA